MRVTRELRQSILDRVERKGSLRKAAKGRDIRWYDLHDAVNRPEVMSHERIMRVYEAFDVQPPTRKRYWRPCLSLETQELADQVQRDMFPFDSVDHIIQAALLEMYNDPKDRDGG